MPVQRIVNVPWFILPPSMEWYYKQKNAFFRELPPWHPACRASMADQTQSFSLMYPAHGGTVYIPVELNGKQGSLVFQAACRSNDAVLFWHLDDRYIGATQHIHRLEFFTPPGEHVVAVVSETGEERRHRFTVLTKESR